MKEITVMKAIFVLLVFIASFNMTSAAHAQGYQFTYFQCDPISCKNTGPPEFQGSVSVSYNSTCSGGVITGIDGSAQASIGINGPCPNLYIPQALVETFTTELLDDFGCPYFIDTVRNHSEIYNQFGIIVLHISNEASCDGGGTNDTISGTRPC
jgi:hypothetical protein